MPKLFLSELQAQLNLVKERLLSMHIPRGPLAPKPDPKMVEERRRLVARRKELEEKIMWYEPPADK